MQELGLKTVRVRLSDNYMTHLHARELEMYEGPALQLVASRCAEIVTEEKPKQKKKKSKARRKARANGDNHSQAHNHAE